MSEGTKQCPCEPLGGRSAAKVLEDIDRAMQMHDQLQALCERIDKIESRDTRPIKYLTLEGLSATLNLPMAYLRRLAETDTIPCLDVNGRRRFNPLRVQAALDQRAISSSEGERYTDITPLGSPTRQLTICPRVNA